MGAKKLPASIGADLNFDEQSPRFRLLAPRLRKDARIVPQEFQGKTWFVLQDPVTLQFYRLGEAEHDIIMQLDGHATLGEIHDRMKAKHLHNAPSFRDMVTFILMLRQANLTVPEAGEDSRWEFERNARARRQKTLRLFTNFLYISIPLVDPDRLLQAALPWTRWIFTRAFFAIWLLVIGAGLVVFSYHATALAEPANGILAPENLLWLYVAFILIKTLHELGHAFAARHYGAEVHRLGIMLLIFTPVPYVDVSPVWAFTSKWAKALVGCAGMMTELFIASLALFAWTALEPGTVKTVLYNMIFIAGVSSVLFNGNPLLRYDAYYILADLIEMPNLQPRSAAHMLNIIRRRLVGEAIATDATQRERIILVLYGILSTCYRVFVVAGIILFVSSKLFIIGLALAIGAVFAWLVMPTFRAARYLFTSPNVRSVRGRALGVTGLVAAAMIALVGFLPISDAVRAPCCLEPVEAHVLRADWSGFLSDVRVSDGQMVEAGQALAVAVNPELDRRIGRARASVAESSALMRDLLTRDLASAQAESERLAQLEKELELWTRRREALTFRSPIAGRVIAPSLERIRGQFINVGDVVCTIASMEDLRVTCVLDPADEKRVRDAAGAAVRVKFQSDAGRVLSGVIERIYPSGTRASPAPALTNAAGGPVILDPSAPDGNRTLLMWHRVDVRLASGSQAPVGVTGSARILTGRAPLGEQIWRGFRRMIQRRFQV